MGTREQQLSNGNKVTLASWEGMEPTTHTEDLYEKKFRPSEGREGLKFYDSTINYMRNDWAKQHMSPTAVNIGNSHALLFYHEKTNSWHSAEALDIDHVSQWKDHLKNIGAKNMAEAQMGYNDIGNLRLLPSVHNRSRDSVDRMFDQRDNNPRAWNNWIEKSFGFDSSVNRPAFDPEKDQANRKKTTIEQPWTEESTRSELRFDKKVQEKWFEHQLQQNFAGSVKLKNPGSDAVQEVPLFRCAATGQLVTRDALDIDHKIPYEVVLEKMKEIAQRDKFELTKAHVLDAYNDTSNLRLVSRSANSSHEWEIGKDGEFRDKFKPEKPGEFDGFIVQDKGLDPQVSQMIREHFNPVPQPQVISNNNNDQVNVLIPRRVQDMQAPMQPSQSLSSQPIQAPKLNESGHSSYNVYENVMKGLQQVDHYWLHMGSMAEREQMATGLMLLAKHHQMPGIDKVMLSKDGHGVVAVHGLGTSNENAVGLGFEQAKTRTVEQNSTDFDKIRPQQVSQGDTSQQHHHLNKHGF